ncbi:UDP-phosphate galactose phosphotransferase [Deinococcus arenae]|uniref:UDP-phosphate galactose phosphotransferase n=1 Tax=Deinococcus arenae TaxID=1452751 RepID=A0A8H9GLR8_9DEIO|nr:MULTISPECIES: sugar transferase [Deinococcus]AWT37697.1 sugar transferase [Deinococcus actinosclerus]GGM38041.1 UDP-phosphate galactose phosphotransferase [Deinococcus arenae]
MPEAPPVRDPYPLKRPLDALAAVVLLLLTWPLLLLIALAVRVDLGRPVLFRQVRPGQHGQLFTMMKFRTMRDATDASGTPLPDAARLTRFGQLLRASSLDELPELINVLRGEMSLVGPRPLLPEYLPRYSPQQARRHEVRPGLTGWAQVNGRNALTWERKFALDVWYVDHASLALDLRILLLTVGRVFRRADILPEGQSEVAAFLGSVPAPLSVPAREVSGAAAHTRSLP